MTVRRVHSTTVVEQVEGVFDPLRASVELGLDVGSLLSVVDFALNEVP